MLLSLKIENIAIIESADIEFDSGLNVLTGETGAGKSIIIDSINAVLGERTSRELIRTGASSARVTALFSDVSGSVRRRLAEFDIFPDEDGNILLQRTLSADGKNSCRINGVPATVSVLRQVGHELINIHGQHDNQALLSPERHFTFIDSIAGNSALLSEYREKFALLCSYIKERESLNTDEAEKLRQLDLLDFQIDELEQADIKPGEREELVGRKGDGDTAAGLLTMAEQIRGDFFLAMADDFNTALAISHIFELAKEINVYYNKVMNAGEEFDAKNFAAVKAIFDELTEIIGILEQQPEAVDDEEAAEIEKLLAERLEARKNKDWARADAIRDGLKARGIIIEDSAGGSRWKRA